MVRQAAVRTFRSSGDATIPGAMTKWEPQTYLRYADVRFRAGMDLIAHIPKKAYANIYDLGCGTGYLTRVLAESFPEARVVGVDSSREMLAEARREFPEMTWVEGEIQEWRPEKKNEKLETRNQKKRNERRETRNQKTETKNQRPGRRNKKIETGPELIFSNAALHWVADHETLLPRLLAHLGEGGVLAAQMPRHFDSPSHMQLAEIVKESRQRERLEPLLLAPIASPQSYWKWLAPHARSVDIWETIYLQVLDGPDPVVNFMRGTALRPFLSVLSKEEGEGFMAEFARRMMVAYPPEANGQTLFPFRRLFVVAEKS